MAKFGVTEFSDMSDAEFKATRATFKAERGAASIADAANDTRASREKEKRRDIIIARTAEARLLRLYSIYTMVIQLGMKGGHAAVCVCASVCAALYSFVVKHRCF